MFQYRNATIEDMAEVARAHILTQPEYFTSTLGEDLLEKFYTEFLKRNTKLISIQRAEEERRNVMDKDYGAMEIYPGVSVRSLQERIKRILVYFMQLCRENNLRYWCAGGTMLGAVRHKGFIPWDDDIDVFMPRSDYEKFYSLWPSVGDLEHYCLCRTTKEKMYHQTDMQLVDLETTFINRHSANEDIEHGLSIDIMPFEGVPESKVKRAAQIYHAVMYSVYNVQRLPDHQGKVLRFLTSILLNMVKNPDKRYRIWKHHEKKLSQYAYDESKTVKEMIANFKALFLPYPRETFDTIDVPFEDIVIKIPRGYDVYMKAIYGDYMSLPPEEDRIPKHDVVYVNLDEPFIQYKGIHYCKENDVSERKLL